MLKVVIAYDGSIQAHKALELLRWWPSSALDVLIATAVPGPGLNEIGDAVDRDAGKESEAVDFQRKALEYLSRNGIKGEAVICTGDPANSVLDLAEAAKADIIITGSRGLNLAKRVLLGSVSEDIVRRATCPVLLAR